MSVRREEVEAALEARRELGKGYEDEIVDALVEKIERRLDERLERQRRPVLARPSHHLDARVALGSIALGIGATAVATDHNAAWLAVIAWIAIAIVNLAYALRR